MTAMSFDVTDQRNLNAQIYKAQKKYSKPPVSLEGQLLWREFFYTVSFHRKTLLGCPNMHMGAAHCAIYYFTLHNLHLNRFECRNHHAFASLFIQIRDERHACHRLQVGAGTENFHQMEGNPVCKQERGLEHANDCYYNFVFIFACSAKNVTRQCPLNRLCCCRSTGTRTRRTTEPGTRFANIAFA